MGRYEDLKEKGWANLTKEERAEYQTLRTDVEVANTLQAGTTTHYTTTDTGVKPLEKEKTITMTKEELDKMIAERIEADRKQQEGQHIGTVKADNQWQEYKEPVKPNKIAKFRLYRENGEAPYGLIVDKWWLRDDYDENTRTYSKKIYKIVVQYDDMSRKEYEIEYVKLGAIADIEKVEIINEDRKVLSMSQGQVNKAYRDTDGYIYSPHAAGGAVKIKGEISGKVPLLVKRDDVMCTVRRANGQTFQIHVSKLNG
jgi:hypothetical protein